ncbi:MAG: cytidine deaminase [Fimbriimonas sp.]
MSEALLSQAFDARARAYAPYSGYAVGAAIVSDDGTVFQGCNVENVSFGATMCAERVALFSMVATGRHRIRSVAVATRDGGTPCGMCLQALLEFAPDPASVQVTVGSEEGAMRTFTLAELIPYGFRSNEVVRTE